MIPSAPSIPFLTDEDVPDSVGNILASAGHDVVRVRDVLIEGSADPVVAAACRESGYTLVTCNYRHFRRLTRAALDISNAEANDLCRIELACEQAEATGRVRKALSLIEHEWALYSTDRSQRLLIYVGKQVIRTHR